MSRKFSGRRWCVSGGRLTWSAGRAVEAASESIVRLLDDPCRAPATLAERRAVALLARHERQIVYVLPSRAKVFDSNGASPRTEELALA